jgi:hypothetical protein
LIKIINKLRSKFFNLINKKIYIYKYRKNSILIKKFQYKKIKKVNVYKIINGKIFTNSVDDAAYLKNNFLIKEPSYQYRNSKNSKPKNNIIFKYGTNRLLKKYNGKIISIISGGAAKHNYGHWLFDSISRLLIVLKFKDLKKFDFIYVPALKNKFQLDTLKFLKINKNRIISSEKNKFIQGKEIICTNHPFEHRFDKIPKIIIKDLKKSYLKFAKLSKIKNYKKIYIERDYSKFNLNNNIHTYKDQRILINNHEIKNYLKSLGFKSLKLKNLSFADQIKLFSNANIIISMFGAELSNLIFCKKGTKVLEIKNNKRLNDFKNISIKCKLKHHQINLKPIYKSSVLQNGILYCPLKKLKTLLKI